VSITSNQGPRGASAYEVAVANGFVGSEAEWLESLGVETEVTSQAGNYLVTETDYLVLVDSATPCTVTLPTPVVGKGYIIKSLGVGAVTLDTVAGTIDGEAEQVVSQFDSVQLLSDGTNYHIV
jgi:hypothetical protein